MEKALAFIFAFQNHQFREPSKVKCRRSREDVGFTYLMVGVW